MSERLPSQTTKLDPSSRNLELYLTRKNNNIADFVGRCIDNNDFSDGRQLRAFILGMAHVYKEKESLGMRNGNPLYISKEAVVTYEEQKEMRLSIKDVKTEWLDEWERVSQEHPDKEKYFNHGFYGSEGQTAAFLGGCAVVLGMVEEQKGIQLEEEHKNLLRTK